MASRKGTLLERNVELLLRLSGFNPQLNRICNGYEIDVFLRYKNLKIAFECKQYERSTLTIRNLIHQWNSKNKELNFDGIVLVLVGCDISSKDYQLAKKYGIIIWDEQRLTNLLDSAIEKKMENRDTTLKEMGIKSDEIKETEKEKIEIEETEQQIIIKKALGEMLKRGLRGSGFVIFDEEETGLFVQYSFDEKGFMIFFPKSALSKKYIDGVRELLESLQFEDSSGKKEVEFSELNEKEFVFENDGIYAQCGEDTKFIAYLTDRIFRGVFQSDNNYKIKIQLELNG